jgi:molybdate transport system substrate-binding protein
MTTKLKHREAKREISREAILPAARLGSFLLFAFLLLLAACSSHETANRQASAPEITAAAAADLTPAFEELGKVFEQESGVKVIFMFGSTGNLAKQIENGAPVDLFAAANISFIEELERKGLIVPDTKALYARGRVTLWTRADNPLGLNRIEDLARPEVKRVAIANPEHAPYGVAAREALQSAGIWDVVQPKLVLGENVRQALQYAETGNVDAAITALSLSTQSDGHWTLIPEQMHRPLDQALAVIKNAQHEQQARSFAAFINSDRGRSVMRKYGFILPGEEPVP